MSGILPFASIQNPVWTPLAREIHSTIWGWIGLEVVRGYVREWATTWNRKSKANEIEQEKQNELFKNEANWCSDWQPILPAVPLPPSSESISIVEKWASLAAIQDVFGFTGDKVLPWPLPKDDHDLVAYTEWLSGDARAYQLLLRRASELPESYADTLRDWLSSARKNPHIVVTSSLPKDERNGAVTTSIDDKGAKNEIPSTKETESANSSGVNKPKRSTVKGEGQVKLIAALSKHHEYADGSCLYQEPIGNNALARLAGVSGSTASTFFEKEFGGLKKYEAICSDVSRLITALKLLNQEFSPHILFGDNPPDEATNPEHKGDRSRKPRGSESGHDSD